MNIASKNQLFLSQSPPWRAHQRYDADLLATCGSYDHDKRGLNLKSCQFSLSTLYSYKRRGRNRVRSRGQDHQDHCIESWLEYRISKTQRWRILGRTPRVRGDWWWWQGTGSEVLCSNDTFDGVIGETVRGEVDVGMGQFFIVPWRLDVLDLTNFYDLDGYCFMLMRPPASPPWTVLFRPLDVAVWISIILTMAILLVMSYVMLRRFPRLGGNPDEGAINVIRIFLGQNGSQQLRRWERERSSENGLCIGFLSALSPLNVWLDPSWSRPLWSPAHTRATFCLFWQ